MVLEGKGYTGEQIVKMAQEHRREGFRPVREADKVSADAFKVFFGTEALLRVQQLLAAPKCAGVKECSERVKLVNEEFLFEKSASSQRMWEAQLGKKDAVLVSLLECMHEMLITQDESYKIKFLQVYHLYTHLVKVTETEYFTAYGHWLICIVPSTGKVYKKKYKGTIKSLEVLEKREVIGFTWNRIKIKSVKGDALYFKYVSGCYSDMRDARQELPNKKKVYYISRFSNGSADDAYGKGFTIRTHHLIALCEWGIDVVKLCQGECSVLTVDHKEKDTLDNAVEHLGVLTREDNRKKGRLELQGLTYEPYDIGDLYKSIKTK